MSTSFPGIWGSGLWNMLHTSALASGEDGINTRVHLTALREFINKLPDFLPCPGCVRHTGEYIARHPPVFDTSLAAFVYTVNLHNSVNARLGKMQFSTRDARDCVYAQQSGQATHHISDMYIQPHWTTLFHLTYTSNVSVQAWTHFMRQAILCLSFTHTGAETDVLEAHQAVLLHILDNATGTPVITLLDIRNKSAALYGHGQYTQKDVLDLFQIYTSRPVAETIANCVEKRIADHKAIQQLRTDTCSRRIDMSATVVTVLMSMVTCVLIVIMVSRRWPNRVRK